MANVEKLKKAACGGDLAEVKKLVASGCAPDIRGLGGCTSLMYAAGRIWVAVMDYLVEARRDIEARDELGLGARQCAAKG